jgi:hypothetical protein
MLSPVTSDEFTTTMKSVRVALHPQTTYELPVSTLRRARPVDSVLHAPSYILDIHFLAAYFGPLEDVYLGFHFSRSDWRMG